MRFEVETKLHEKSTHKYSLSGVYTALLLIILEKDEKSFYII